MAFGFYNYDTKILRHTAVQKYKSAIGFAFSVNGGKREVNGLKTFSIYLQVMKFSFLLLPILLIACSNQQKTQTPQIRQKLVIPAATRDTNNFNRTVFDVRIFQTPLPGFSIGDIYNIKLSDTAYCTLLLAGIDSFGNEYSFYHGSTIFSQPPSREDIFSAELAGHKIATSAGVSIKYVPGIHQQRILKADLERIKKAFNHVAYIPLSDSVIIGEYNQFATIHDLQYAISLFVKIKEGGISRDTTFLDNQPCAVAFDYVLQKR